MRNNLEKSNIGVGAHGLTVTPRNGDFFMDMRAARTNGVFRGADLESQKYGFVSKTVNPKFERNLPAQLVVSEHQVDVPTTFFDNIDRIGNAFGEISQKLDELIKTLHS
jgi:hypothetical protein